MHSTLRLASGIGHIQIYQKSVRILKTSLGAMHIQKNDIFIYYFYENVLKGLKKGDR